MAAKMRFKCPHCGEIVNARPDATQCPECHRPVSMQAPAYIYLYRQGSFYGVAGGFGVYINGQPFGYIGNKELLCIPVAYGSYTLHCAVGMSRECRDMVVNLTPQCPVAYTKVYIKPGFWTNSFVIEPVDPGLLDL